jgi:hypothetical protein
LILHAVGRIVLVPLGFLLGLAAAVWVLLTLGLEVTTQTLAHQASDADKVGVLIDIGLGFLRVFAAASILPALLVVIVGEVARIRSVLYYVLGGGLALAMFPLLARIGTTLPDASGSVPIRAWAVLSTAGFAGGLVYWVIAGRRA